jgi:hypothetical protein
MNGHEAEPGAHVANRDRFVVHLADEATSLPLPIAQRRYRSNSLVGSLECGNVRQPVSVEQTAGISASRAEKTGRNPLPAGQDRASSLPDATRHYDK